MRRIVLSLLGPTCALILLLVCFHAVLFGDEQFAYRDAAHFYYPLYLRVQQEWDAGRWPLWDPWQNAGMPLLGLPMAAVLYPGKLLHAALPYPWAARLYVVAHVALAWAGMFALARAWGRSAEAAGLAALAYAFGAPVLFQYSNVIFLVGAAWVPWGLAAADALLRRRRRAGLLGLAVVLALQVLGGDPEAAYLTVLCAGGYALVLATQGMAWPSRLFRVLRRPWVVPLVVVFWVAAVAGAGSAWPGFAETPWPAIRRGIQASLWGGVGLGVAWSWWRQGGRARLGPMLARLAGACALAVALAAVQLLPSLEFSRRSLRAADVTMNIYYFSVEPFRLLELAWPGAYGMTGAENQSYFQALPQWGNHALWTPSLYLGGLTVALAAGAAGMRDGPPWRHWLLGVLLVGLLASFGRFAGPLWWLRWLRVVPRVLGPHDPSNLEVRDDEFLSDGAGSPYGLMELLLPGFALFRYPGKLMTFNAVALAGLAALGWDLLAEGRTRRPARWCAWGLAATLAVAVLTTAARPWIVATLTPRLIPDSAYGPIDLPASLAWTWRALIHGAVLFAAGLGLATLAPRRPRLAGMLALVVMTLDLGVANARLIWTVPQATFEGTPRIARLIDDAEKADPSPGPFRIHRMPLWYPERFTKRRSPRRHEELTRWERDTLQPSYGLPLDYNYCLTQGALELFDYLAFFRSQEMKAGADAARYLGVAPGQRVTYYPRRAFNLWNARYFILPIRTDQWKSSDRGYGAFLPDTEPIYPGAEFLKGPEGESWRENEDWQLLRNKAVFPRAWLVHFVRVRKPITGMNPNPGPGDELRALMKDLVYQPDVFWDDPERHAYDLRAMAFVETDQLQGLAGYVAKAPVSAAESVEVARHEPQRVELVARLERPGLVVLADTYYPGWRLTIDGRPAPIYRTNRMMRGAAVGAGRHTLVYTYEPASFRVGGVTSLAGLLALAALVPWAARRPRRPDDPDAAA
jgi:hypothetical protein